MIMPGFTISGIIIALIGTLLLSPEIFFGYGGILADAEEQAEEQYGNEHAQFAGDEEHKERKKREYRRKISRYKSMRFVGLLFIIIGFSLQILGVTQ
jgi:hypothetical protein